jgi:hypothetical protein
MSGHNADIAKATFMTQKRHHQPMKEAIGGSSGIALQFFGS